MKQQKMPIQVIHDFFDFAKPSEWQELLWLWFSATVTGNFPKEMSRKERETIVMTYEKLHEFIDQLGKIQEKG